MTTQDDSSDARTPFEREAFQDAWTYTKLLREHVQKRYLDCHDESLLILIANLDLWLQATEHKLRVE